MRLLITLSICLAWSPYVNAALIRDPGNPTSSASPRQPVAMSTPTPATFDPTQFAPITTGTLPTENGQPIVMRVNGRAVTWDDFAIQARLAGASIMAEHPGHESNIMAALASPVAEALIIQELYREFADRNHLQVEPTEIGRQQDELESSRNPSIKQATALLTEQQTRQLMTDALIREKVNKFLGDRATSTPPTMQEITSFTATAKPTTAPIEITRARHIVIRATPDMSQFNINDAKARAEEALAKIRAGADFATTARQYSQDRFTAYQGGNIGYYTTGTMYQEFETAAAKLAAGDVSEVVRTPVGFHIIQVTERQPDDLRLQLDNYKKQIAVLHWKEEAAQAANVERFLPN